MSYTPSSATPASGGEQEPTGPLGMSVAARVLAKIDDTTEPAAEAATPAPSGDGADQSPPDQETPTDDAEAEAQAQTEETAPTPDGEEPEPAVEAEPEAEPEDDQYVHGNARTRLRDGTVTTVGELKKLAEEAREYRAKAPEIAAQHRAIEERAAQLAQQEQLVQQILPQTLQLLQARLPPEPNPSLMDEASPDYDPIRFLQDKHRYDMAIAEMQQLGAMMRDQYVAQQRKQEEASAAESNARAAAGHKYLLGKIPEIADPQKAKALFEGLVSTAEKFGLSRDDVMGIESPQAIHLFHTLRSKAEAYDRLMAQKPAVQQRVARASPVQTPSARVSQEDTAKQAVEAEFERWRKSGGGMAGAAKILATLD